MCVSTVASLFTHYAIEGAWGSCVKDKSNVSLMLTMIFTTGRKTHCACWGSSSFNALRRSRGLVRLDYGVFGRAIIEDTWLWERVGRNR